MSASLPSLGKGIIFPSFQILGKTPFIKHLIFDITDRKHSQLPGQVLYCPACQYPLSCVLQQLSYFLLLHTIKLECTFCLTSHNFRSLESVLSIFCLFLMQISQFETAAVKLSQKITPFLALVCTFVTPQKLALAASQKGIFGNRPFYSSSFKLWDLHKKEVNELWGSLYVHFTHRTRAWRLRVNTVRR